jgi:predicted amidohydrolase YtcJ
LHLEADRGSIEPGKLADFAVLDGDPLADPEALRDLQVTGTFVGGEPLS